MWREKLLCCILSGVCLCLLHADTIPAKWDAREYGLVTSVKDQGNYDTCWIFATMSAIETSILKNGGPALDLSEKNLANLHGWDFSPISAGTYLRAASYLLRWAGPVLESQDPYPKGGRTVDDFGGSGEFQAVAHVQNMVEIASRNSSLDNDALKQAVMRYGSVVVRFHRFRAAPWYNVRTGAHFSDQTNDTNHAVALIGWDDSYPKSNFLVQPQGDGAWLVKDSHGSNSGTNGFMYVSYYDSSFAYKDSAAFVVAGRDENYSGVYGYDKLGRCNTRGTGKCGDRRYGAAIFSVAGGARQELCAVGFYPRSDPTLYEISVYTNCTRVSPVSGVCVIENQTGRVDYCGFATIKLDRPVVLQAGVNFSIVIGLTTPNYEYQIAYEWSTDNASGATAGSGETFYGKSKSSWEDFSEYKPNASFCCKAYVRNIDEDASVGEGDLSEYSRWLREAYPNWANECSDTPTAIADLNGANGKNLRDNWLAGVSPEDAEGSFRAIIRLGLDGHPIVSWYPALNGENIDGSGIRDGIRKYNVYGKCTLDDRAEQWQNVDIGAESLFHFFKVEVSMP